MASKDIDLTGLPMAAPPPSKSRLRYADVHQVAVTATAPEFAGIYRGGKQYHPPDFAATLERALTAGVEKVILTGMSLDDIAVNTEIAREHRKQCSITIGIHPYHASVPESGVGQQMARLGQAVDEALAAEPRVISAFGELGLDYDRLNHASKADQLRVFKAQLDLFVSYKWDLPLFLHCRSAFSDFIEVLKPYLPHLPKKGLVHSFVGSPSEMLNLASLGFDISVNGFSFADRESVDMVAAVPLERLQLETDAPWGEVKAGGALAKRYCGDAPVLPQARKRDRWERGCMVKERNESCAISNVAFVVAGLKRVGVEVVAEAAWRNSVEMFGLDS